MLITILRILLQVAMTCMTLIVYGLITYGIWS